MLSISTIVLQQPHEAIAGGIFLGAALWTVIGRVVVAGLRWVAKKTPTKVDDKAVAKLAHVVGYLEEHPEVVDALHSVVTGKGK